MHEILQKNIGKNFIDFVGFYRKSTTEFFLNDCHSPSPQLIPCPDSNITLAKYFRKDYQVLSKEIKRDIIKFGNGSFWNILSKDFAHFVVKNTIVKAFYAVIKYSQAPQNIFFQTVIYNTHFNQTLIRKNLRITVQNEIIDDVFIETLRDTKNFFVQNIATVAVLNELVDNLRNS